MNPKSFTLEGKRYKLLPVIPIQQISWLVQRMHVSALDADVRDSIVQRVGSNSGWTKQAIEQAQHYAVKCHRDNQALFNTYRF